MNRKQKKVLYRIITSLVLLVILELISPGLPQWWWLTLMLYLIPYLIIGYDILKKAVLGICHGEVFDENFLMAIATVGAMILGDYKEGAAVMLFYQIGELFQSVAVGRSRKNISNLMDIRPDYANVPDESGELVQVDPDEVAVGTVILVRPGEKIPIDGVVEEGTSSLDTVALTGESVPREAKPGDAVISGCINMTGVLRVRTTKEFGESTVSKILELVENSSMKKAKVENFISRFARYYTPAVCYSALALAVLPPVIRLILGMPADVAEWVTRALTFLVISCPCALVISIPLSFFGGIGGASSCGILVKGANYLEALAKTGYVVFDKTGTLTQGVFRVTQIVPQQSAVEADQPKSDEAETVEETAKEHQDEAALLEYAAYAEYYSNHLISRSLKDAYSSPIDPSRISDVEEISGHGVMATVDGKQIAAGNERLMERIGLQVEAPTKTGTVVYVAIDSVYSGYILISDVVKEQSGEAIRSLKRCGVKKTVMLTGDSKAVAEDVASMLGLDDVRSELLPTDKVTEVEMLLENKEGKELLAFVGDGINDAPVLSRADIGIAMGAMGSDAAIEAADVVLMDDDPRKIALAIRIARKCMTIVYQNIVFALGIKGICLVLGAAGIANMWLAVFADVGVMVIAVMNAVRCLNVKSLQSKTG